MSIKLGDSSIFVILCLIVMLPAPSAHGQTSGVSSTVQVTIPASVSQGGFTGSVPSGQASPEVLSITFLDAIDGGAEAESGIAAFERQHRGRPGREMERT